MKLKITSVIKFIAVNSTDYDLSTKKDGSEIVKGFDVLLEQDGQGGNMKCSSDVYKAIQEHAIAPLTACTISIVYDDSPTLKNGKSMRIVSIVPVSAINTVADKKPVLK